MNKHSIYRCGPGWLMEPGFSVWNFSATERRKSVATAEGRALKSDWDEPLGGYCGT